MGVVGAVARVELRQRWRLLVLLGLLAGLAGGIALGALAGARRTDTAFARAVEATRPGDITVRAFDPGIASGIPALPEVERSWSGRITVGQVLGGDAVQYVAVLSGPPPPPELFRPQLVAGRFADPANPEEAVVGAPFAEEFGVRPGQAIDLKLLTLDEIGRFGEGFGEPDGPAVHLQVVGVVRVAGTTSGQLLPVLATPAFYERHTDAGEFVVADLRRGRDDVASFRAGVEALAATARATATTTTSAGSADALPPFDIVTPDNEARAAARAARVVVIGLLLLAGVSLVAGGVAVTQASGLYAARRRADQATLRAIGMSRRERVQATALPVALVSAPVAVIVAVALAVAGSDLTPVGSAAADEPHPGVEANLAILLPGALLVALALVACVSLLGARTRLRPKPPASRPSAAERLARANVPPVAAIGARFALEPGSGRTAVPVRSTLLAAVIGVAGVVAAATYGGSLHQVVHDPARYGYPADAEVVDVRDDQLPALLADPDVAALADGYTLPVRVGGSDAIGVALGVRKGVVRPTMLAGRAPGTPDEVSLGPATEAATGARIGDDVVVRDATGVERTLTVVGTHLVDGDTTDDFDRTALLTVDGLRAFGDDGSTRRAYLRFAPGVDVGAKVRALAATVEVDGPNIPTPITNLEQLDRLPIALASFFGAIAAIAAINAAGTALSRRRRDIATLRALGLTPRQSSRVLLGMVTTVAVVGVVGGIPLGLLIGRVLWRTVADGVHVPPAVVVPGLAILAVTFGALVVANLAGAVPASLAARRTAGTDLHAE